MQETILFRDLAVVLLAATLSGWILQRLGFSAVVGYLPESTPELGKTLAELNLSVRFGLQICGIEPGECAYRTQRQPSDFNPRIGSFSWAPIRISAFSIPSRRRRVRNLGRQKTITTRLILKILENVTIKTPSFAQKE